jgi:histidinol phosphatase-like PHP family hydrolase
MKISFGMRIEMKDIHTHSDWSDGDNSQKEIVENAIRHCFDTIGISDHFGLITPRSVLASGLTEYLDALVDLKALYEQKIKILTGLELPAKLVANGFDSKLTEFFNRLDYVLIEDMEFTPSVSDYAKIRDNLEKITCNKGLAHCNLFKLCSQMGLTLDALVDDLRKSCLFWEVNASMHHAFFDEILYYSRYKSQEVGKLFDTINDHGVRTAIGSDSHSIDEIPYGRLSQANMVVNEYLLPMEF